MDFSEVLLTRRSVRSYSSKAIDAKVLGRVLNAARMAPSANNVQPWRFIVVSDEDKRKAIAKISANQSFIAEAPAVVVCCGKRYVDRWSWIGENMYLIDTAIAIDHLTLAARNEGLGTCWVGAFDHEDLRRLLNVPDGFDVIVLTPLGYPAKPDAFYETSSRKPLDEVVFAGSFGNSLPQTL